MHVQEHTRAEGNEAIRYGQYSKAEGIYTQCLHHEGDDSERSLLLCNRSFADILCYAVVDLHIIN